MTDPTPAEDAVRRALREVAGSTPSADREPPALAEGAVVRMDDRPGRRERWLLGAAAAAVVIVAGLLVAALAVRDDEPDTVSTADDPTTTTERSTTSTTSPSTTVTTNPTTIPSTTVTAVAPPNGVREGVIASGPGWEAIHTVGEADGPCIRIVADGEAVSEWCGQGVEPPEGLVGLAISSHVGGSTPMVIIQNGDIGVATTYVRQSGGFGLATLDPADDPLGTGLSFLVGDLGADLQGEGLSVDLLLRRGDETLGALIGLPVGGPTPADDYLRDGEVFGPWPGYREGAQPLSFDNHFYVGVYTPEGQTCLLVRTMSDPDPRIVVNECVDGGIEEPMFVTRPTVEANLVDIFGLAPPADVTEWTCELPSGTSCGTGFFSNGETAVLAWPGPISVDDGGTRADHITAVIDGNRFEVPIPPAS
jgi:hypothetical protein